jgi:hypothetical protein
MEADSVLLVLHVRRAVSVRGHFTVAAAVHGDFTGGARGCFYSTTATTSPDPETCPYRYEPRQQQQEDALLMTLSSGSRDSLSSSCYSPYLPSLEHEFLLVPLVPSHGRHHGC